MKFNRVWISLGFWNLIIYVIVFPIVIASLLFFFRFSDISYSILSALLISTFLSIVYYCKYVDNGLNEMLGFLLVILYIPIIISMTILFFIYAPAVILRIWDPSSDVNLVLPCVFLSIIISILACKFYYCESIFIDYSAKNDHPSSDTYESSLSEKKEYWDEMDEYGYNQP